MMCKNMTPREFFESKKNTWTGCNWTTEHGASRLNLEGVTAKEAYEFAVGEKDWLTAARWLEQVEEDAAGAQFFAQFAVEDYEKGAYVKAIEQAQRAAYIEGRYGKAPTWGRLAEVIASAAEEIFRLVAEGERE